MWGFLGLQQKDRYANLDYGRAMRRALDYLVFAEPGSADDSYFGSAFSGALVKGKPAQMRTPATPGKYELRYLSPARHPQVLGRLLVDVVASSIRIDAVDKADAGDRIKVRAVGPYGANHWIGIAARGAPVEKVLSYARVDPSGTSNVELNLPGEPGAYEIRYVLNERESIAAMRPITVERAAASFGTLPKTFAPGSPVSIAYQGPRGESNWIGFVKRGGGTGDYASFGYVPTTGPVEFFSPADAGDFDLVLVVPVNGVDEIKLRVPVQVR